MADINFYWHPDNKETELIQPKYRAAHQNHIFMWLDVKRKKVVSKLATISLKFQLKHEWDEKYYPNIFMN